MDKMNSLLIVDDDASNLMELASILKPEYKIYAVKDGVPALEKAHEALPDLILLDVVMPDMNGFEVLAELKRSDKTKDIPVIFITGVNDSESEHKGLSIGAVDYIRKPFDPMVVKHRVRLQIQIVNLQRDLENAVVVAEAANQSKSSFLANMSHEIRTPMNAIMGITDILLQDENTSTEEISEGLNKIYNSSEMLLSLINDILDFSKIEAGKLDILPATYSIAEMINETIHLNVMRIEKKPIVFELDIDDYLPAKFVGDELRIKQVLNNILSNAFKYTEAGKVILSVRHEEESNNNETALVLSVKDTGKGMTDEQLERLFDEYSRFDELYARSIEGTGLGLSIMHRLVTLMNGSVNVESEPEKGTTITIRLPQGTVDENILGKKTADDLRNFRQRNVLGRESKKIEHEPMPYGKVLVVDDVDTNLFVAVRFMKPYKLVIETATNGFEAIDRIKSGSTYDVIFMDHMMPDMDGIETTGHLRDLGYANPVVALTANAMTGQAEMFLNNGFDEFISKPIDIKQLDSILKKLIRDKQPQEVIDAAINEHKSSIEAEGNDDGKKSDEGLDFPDDVDDLIIESFAQDARKAVSILNDLYSNNDWYNDETNLKKFTITVHGMKSILECINETELSKIARSLEVAGRGNDVITVKAYASEFLDKLRALLKKIEQSSGEVSHGIEDDIDDLRGKFISIKELCAGFNRKGIQAILDDINSISEKTRAVVSQTKEHILLSEFEEAEKVVDEYIAALSKVSRNAKSDPPADGASRLIDRKIDGLDIEKGLERYEGDERAYLRTLRSYVLSTSSMLDTISEVDEENLDNYKTTVHGIKGASYDLNANKVGKLADDLEVAANNGNFEFISKNNQTFIDSTRSFIGSIEELLAAIADENPRPRKDRPEESALLKLLKACEDYSMDDVDAAMSEIEEFKYDEDDDFIVSLRKCIDVMQFPKVVKIISEKINNKK